MPRKKYSPSGTANAAKQSRHAKTLLSFLFGQANGAAIFHIVALLVLLGWTADTLLEGYIHLREQAWSHHPGWGWVMATAPIVLFACWLLGLRQSAKRNLEKATLRAESRPVRGRRTLIVLLSNFHQKEGESIEDSNWRIPLEAIKAHVKKKTLKAVWVVGSKNESHEEIGDFEAFIHSQLPESPRLSIKSLAALNVERYAEGVDFDDLEAVVDALELIRIRHEATQPREELIVDITGGKKTTSAAAVTVCQNGNVAFQYVHYKPPAPGQKSYAVEEYRLELVSADDAHPQ